MNGLSRSSRTRGRTGLGRAALVAVIAMIGPLAAPGTASAQTSGGGAGDGTITPFLDCLRLNQNGTYTAILGYTNSARSTETIARGTWNKVSPSKYDGAQPTNFPAGTKHGAFSVTITKSEYMGGPYWYLDGEFVFFGWSWEKSVSTCPPSTELPEDGNGTGPAIVLVAAGVVGAVAVHRVRRRALNAAAPQTGGDRDDA